MEEVIICSGSIEQVTRFKVNLSTDLRRKLIRNMTDQEMYECMDSAVLLANGSVEDYLSGPFAVDLRRRVLGR